MREICTSGSVRGAAHKSRPYRDHYFDGQQSRRLILVIAGRQVAKTTSRHASADDTADPLR